MGMNMRSLNTFAGGVSSGIGAGSSIANRKQLTDLAVASDAREGEKMGLLKAADKRAGDQAAEMTELMKIHAPNLWKKLYGMPEAPGEGGGSFEGSAVPTPPSITKTPIPNAQSFAQQSAGAQPAPTFGAQQRPRVLPPGTVFGDWISGQ